MTDKPKKKGRNKKIARRIIWSLILLIAVGAALWSVYSKLQADYRITYDPYVATTGSISNSLSFTGSVQLINSASLTADANAKVRQVYVAVGDRVRKGDKLLRLSSGAALEAGFNGTVSAVSVAKGDEVKAGDTLLTLADFDHLRVSIRVGESDINQVAVGQSCRVTVSSVGATLESVIGTIDHVSYTGNNVAYYTTTVDVDASGSAGIWPGMQATVTVPLEEAQDVTVLKMEALSTARDNTAYIFKETASGEMEQVPVTVGVSNGNYVEIKDGVVSGETVYKVAEKEEQPTGLAALFSGMFTNQQVNRPSGNWQNRNGTDYNNSNRPGRDSNNNGAPAGTRGN